MSMFVSRFACICVHVCGDQKTSLGVIPQECHLLFFGFCLVVCCFWWWWSTLFEKRSLTELKFTHKAILASQKAPVISTCFCTCKYKHTHTVMRLQTPMTTPGFLTTVLTTELRSFTKHRPSPNECILNTSTNFSTKCS